MGSANLNVIHNIKQLSYLYIGEQLLATSAIYFCFVCAGMNDLFTVYSELVGVAHMWKKVGLALRLHPNLLRRIEAKKNDVEDNLSDVLEEWLKKSYDTESFGDPSWKLLVDAVAHRAGGKDRALAMEIAAKYNGKFNW